MLAQTIRNNLTDNKQVNVRTKAAKFGNMFQTAPNTENKDPKMVQVLMKAGLVNLDKNNELLKNASVPKTVDFGAIPQIEENDYIVENPNEVIVNFPIQPVIEMKEKLPFFKSLSAKLAAIAIDCPV